MKIYLDSNILIAFLNQDHVDHSKVQELVDNLDDRAELYISNYVVDEFIYIMTKSYAYSNPQVAKVLKQFISNSVNLAKEISDQKNVTMTYLDAFGKNSVSPRDLMHFFIAKLNDIDAIVTFDKKFAKFIKGQGMEVLNSVSKI